MNSNLHYLVNMFQHKYLIYNKECTLLTYAVQTKIKIDDLASFKDVTLIWNDYYRLKIVKLVGIKLPSTVRMTLHTSAMNVT